jgi:S-DNA-T family DNA segregation ATPase FtsK/SpoIIIE
VITDEMNANLQFRICLRVQNIEASRAMLRRPDAAYLPAGWPGRGYFQVGERGVFKQFQTAYVGADYERSRSGETNDDEPVILELITDGGQAINLLQDSGATFLSADSPADESSTIARAICETVIRYAQDENVPWMKPILLHPLPDTMTLAEPLEQCGVGGWNGHDWNAPGRDHDSIPIRTGSAPVGLIDDVYNRTQHPLWIHLNAGDVERAGRKDGHVMVVGSPGTGKTAFLRALAISEALLHSPDKVQMYFLSFTGTGLDDLGNLPHAERVIYGTETERVRRLFGRLLYTLSERQSGRADSFAPVIMICIDQFEQLRDSYRETHLIDFERLINEGRSVGIYLVFTASSVSAVPDRIRSLVQQRIALQAGDSGDYGLLVGRLDRQMTETLQSGRGFLYNSPPLLCQIGLPCTRAGIDNEPLALESMRSLIREMRAGYEAKTQKPRSPAPIRELPTRIPLEALPFERAKHLRISTALGHMDDDALSAFTLDWWDEGPHFIVTGPPGSGKTNLLQAAVLAAAQAHSPEQVRFLLVDFNGRSLRALGGLKHVIRRVTDPLDLRDELDHIMSELTAFSQIGQENGLSAEAIPATVVVIDDYDTVSEELRMSDDVLAQLRDALRLYAHLQLYVWAAGYLERVVDPLIRHLLLKRSGFGLSVKESLQKLNVRSVGVPMEAMPEGRAYVPQGNRIAVVQTALVEDAYAYAEWINTQWPDSQPASWLYGGEQKRRPAQPQPRPARLDSHVVDIDTAGLIQDLLGDLYDEGKPDGHAVD